MAVKIRRADVKDVQFSRTLSDVRVGLGLAPIDELKAELQEYVDVLLGRLPSPIESPYLALCEVATSYYGRALEMDMLILEGERLGEIEKGSGYYRFRVGILRDFIELSKRAAELGSRRLTQEQVLASMRNSF